MTCLRAATWLGTANIYPNATFFEQVNKNMLFEDDSGQSTKQAVGEKFYGLNIGINYNQSLAKPVKIGNGIRMDQFSLYGMTQMSKLSALPMWDVPMTPFRAYTLGANFNFKVKDAQDHDLNVGIEPQVQLGDAKGFGLTAYFSANFYDLVKTKKGEQLKRKKAGLTVWENNGW